MSKPRLKRFRRILGSDRITLVREAGVEIALTDVDGQVTALLDLLDGSRTVLDVARILAQTWPDLTAADVAEGVKALDAAGLLKDADEGTALTPLQVTRYASNLAFFSPYATLDRGSFAFQEDLRRAHVLLLGVGGLGSALLYHLAGLGVGRITALDCDRVELKNLARQTLYDEGDVGRSKVERAVARARAFNSDIHIEGVERRVEGPEDVASLLPGVDLVLVAIDTPARSVMWINEACQAAGVPFIGGGMLVTRAIYYSVAPGKSPCLECRGGPSREDPHRVNRGTGPVAGLLGALIGLEAVRYLTGFAPPVAEGKVWMFDLATGQVEVGLEWTAQPGCRYCGHLAAQQDVHAPFAEVA